MADTIKRRSGPFNLGVVLRAAHVKLTSTSVAVDFAPGIPQGATGADDCVR